MGSGGLLFSVSLEHTFDAIYIKSPSGLSETEILARYPHVVPPTDKEKVRLYESTIKTVASEMPVGLKGEQLQEMLSDALHVGKGD